MLSPMLLLKDRNTTTSLLLSKHSTGSKINETIDYEIISLNCNSSIVLSPSAVHYPTISFNSFLFDPNTASPSVTSSLKFANRSIAIAAPSFETIKYTHTHHHQ